jgi:hypothetical protein
LEAPRKLVPIDHARPKKKPAEEFKLIKNDKNNKLYRVINAGYKYIAIVCNFTRKLLWIGSCSKQ